MTGNSRRGIVVQPRDEHLLRELAFLMRIIDREQAKLVAGFHSTTRANTRLLALYRAGLLRRFFLGTSAGGQKAFYSSSEKGVQLVGAPYQRLRFRNDELIISTLFLAHLSWVNWVYCWTRYAPCPRPGVSFRHWLNFSEPVASSLVPDAYVEINTPDGPVGAFVEVDLGSEGAAVWKTKVRNYLQYAASGRFQKRFNLAQFRIVVLAKDDQRVQRLRTIVRTFTEKIFWFSALDTIQTQGFWAPAWQRPTGDGRGNLV